ncbi:probable protein phosphatase 2C 75 [Salvia miltiorrhiza]|uniref:probable protein phosphatase 2C 75 n=1 Tax=Salvia miltiorrhiza TaxID=226208 RepID=UPI0025AD01E7|nr:probable protein phosphatase 2C 75 [Salvia miltiorrhiza]
MADIAGTRAYYTKTNVAVEGAAARRHRRNQMRRRRNSDDAAGEEDVPPNGRSDHQEGGAAVHGNGRRDRVPWWRSVVPVAGAVAVAGRQRQMEDAITVWMDLCSPLINRGLPVHYFGVYDGHGGSHFSTICKEKMHEIIKEELIGAAAPGLITDESLLQETWRNVIKRVYARTETVALHTCSACGSEGFRCNCDRSSLSYSGTTAVAVLVTENHFVVGNCGDSRAVLYRRGRFLPLTFDHKPGRADEKARIEASGGQVVNTDTARVQGILAMSRAIGDMFLKPYVISEPDMTFRRRKGEDEFLILASDGLWDVIPTEMAGRVARQCLNEEAGGGSIFVPENEAFGQPVPSRSASAASLLTRLALARSSVDNISVVVVDLKGAGADDV